jgi:enoyl-[acyl-carrier protein] reductase I
MSMLAGKTGIVFGVANKRSIAWAIAQAWKQAGATLAFTYQGDRLKENVEELAGTFGPETLIMPCDVTKDAQITAVFDAIRAKYGKLNLLLHSVAFAPARGVGRDLPEHQPRGLSHGARHQRLLAGGACRGPPNR